MADTMHQVAAYGLFAFVEKRTRLTNPNFTAADVEHASGRVDLGFTGELSSAYRNDVRRYWLDQEASSPETVVSTGPAAPPIPEPTI